MWKGSKALHSINVDATLDYTESGPLRHSLTLADQGGRPIVASEKIEPLRVFRRR